jgi:1-acyl-sn-glycerol-3-phosphate acyltransferase
MELVRLIGSLLFLLFYFVVSVVIYTAAIPLFLGPRIAVIRGAQLWAHLMLWALKIFCGQTYEIRGREYIPHGAALVASKHFSMWETIAFMVFLNDPAIVLKRELMWIPFYGWYGIKMGMIPIDRTAKASAMRLMRRKAKAAKDAGRQILIFPEGTRRNPGDDPAYKPGVAGLYNFLELPCVPVALTSGLVWTGSGLIKYPGKIVVEFLPHIAPGLRRDAFMAELQTRIETATNRLLSEQG